MLLKFFWFHSSTSFPFIFVFSILLTLMKIFWWLVVAQLMAESLLAPEIFGLNPLTRYCIFILHQLVHSPILPPTIGPCHKAIYLVHFVKYNMLLESYIGYSRIWHGHIIISFQNFPPCHCCCRKNNKIMASQPVVVVVWSIYTNMAIFQN